MNPERWQRLDGLFHAALERGAGERAAFIDEACAGDEQLRKKLEALLAAHDEASSFIEDGAIAGEAKELAAEPEEPQADHVIAGQVISHYRIIRRLGAGAMGEAYLARPDGLPTTRITTRISPSPPTAEAWLPYWCAASGCRRIEQVTRAGAAVTNMPGGAYRANKRYTLIIPH